MKILAGRPRGLEDVRGILDSLDVGYIQSMIESLEEALGQRDLVRSWTPNWRLRGGACGKQELYCDQRTAVSF